MTWFKGSADNGQHQVSGRALTEIGATFGNEFHRQGVTTSFFIQVVCAKS
jgi:hypothetical protein